MSAALEAGRIDAASLSEPFMTAARRSGRALEYGFDAISKQFLLTSWCATSDWAKAHADLVARFGAIIHETAIWANKNPGPSGDIFAKYTKDNPADIPTMVHPHYAELMTPALVQPLIDASAKYNGFTAFPARD